MLTLARLGLLRRPDRTGLPRRTSFCGCTLRRCEVSRREATSQFQGDQAADERTKPTSSDGSTPPIIDLRTVPTAAPQLVIGRGTVLSVPSPYTVQNAAGVSVQGTLQVSELGEPVDITLRGIRRSNMRAVRGPTAEQRLASWLRAEGSEYRNATNKDISCAFKKATGVEVGEETIRKARVAMGLSPRKKRSSKTTQKLANANRP